MLRSYEKESEKVEVLKSQLRFRKEVLLQVPENKSSFNFSKSVDGKKSRKSLNSAELSENLKALVRQAIVKDKESCKEKHILVGKRVRHRFREEKEGHVIEKWYTGKIISQVIYNPFFNALPNDKILDLSKFKAFADHKLNVTQKMKFVSSRVENIVGKGENAGYLHFLLFPQCFQKASISGS